MSDKEVIREAVRTRYAEAASSCCDSGSTCCGPETVDEVAKSRALGYSDEELAAVPEGANLGLGCGNPQAIAALRPGEVVLDLGSGAGFDCFLAARQVGPSGQVIGVDMTGEMLSRARENAKKAGYANVEFRLGEIEHLPVADASVDVIISNCVVNLSPDKAAVYKEAHRVLRPGGRLAISDVVATAELPQNVREDLGLLCSCISGAATIEELERLLGEAGFAEVKITPMEGSREFIRTWEPGGHQEDYVVSASIQARKKKPPPAAFRGGRGSPAARDPGARPASPARA